MQRCTNCGEISDHGPNKARKSGLQSWCRTCLNEKKLQRYYEWRDALLQARGPCADCGSWERLEFDHVDPDEKEGNVSKLWSTPQWKEELAKCDVRCHDCHVKRSSREGHFDNTRKQKRRAMPAKPEITNAAPIATLFYGRKVGLPAYGNEEFSCFLQVPLDGVTDEKEMEALLDSQAAFLKAWVLKELNISYTIDPQNNVVMGEVPVGTDKTKATPKYGPKKAPAKASPSAGPTDKAVLWELLATATKHGDNFKASTGETIWDNRVGKRNPNAPDFKFADSGEGLWLDKMPSDFELPV